LIDVSVELPAKKHGRDNFDCGESSLNDYLKRFARQNANKNLGRTFVACESDSERVLAYYTISSGAIRVESLPDVTGLPKFPVPTSHVGRLAVDRTMQGQGLGAYMLVDALKRSLELSRQIGIYAVTVDALNESAKQFYLRFGFVELLDDPSHLYIPVAELSRLP
jgi:GNAT superfamily N-acetyltransferase